MTLIATPPVNIPQRSDSAFQLDKQLPVGRAKPASAAPMQAPVGAEPSDRTVPSYPKRNDRSDHLWNTAVRAVGLTVLFVFDALMFPFRMVRHGLLWLAGRETRGNFAMRQARNDHQALEAWANQHDDRESLRASSESLQADVAALRETQQALAPAVEMAQRERDALAGLQQDIAHAQTQVQQLQRQANESQRTLTGIEQTAQTRSRALQDLDALYLRAREEKGPAAEEFTKLTGDLQTLRYSIAGSSQEQRRMQGLVSALVTRETTLQIRCDALRGSHSGLQSEIARLTAAKNDLAAEYQRAQTSQKPLVDEVAQIRRTLAGVTSELASQRTQLAGAQVSLATSQRTLETTRRALVNARQEIVGLSVTGRQAVGFIDAKMREIRADRRPFGNIVDMQQYLNFTASNVSDACAIGSAQLHLAASSLNDASSPQQQVRIEELNQRSLTRFNMSGLVALYALAPVLQGLKTYRSGGTSEAALQALLGNLKPEFITELRDALFGAGPRDYDKHLTGFFKKPQADRVRADYHVLRVTVSLFLDASSDGQYSVATDAEAIPRADAFARSMRRAQLFLHPDKYAFLPAASASSDDEKGRAAQTLKAIGQLAIDLVQHLTPDELENLAKSAKEVES